MSSFRRWVAATARNCNESMYSATFCDRSEEGRFVELRRCVVVRQTRQIPSRWSERVIAIGQISESGDKIERGVC